MDSTQLKYTYLTLNTPTLPFDDSRGQQTELLSVFECDCHPPFQSQRSLKKTVGALAAHRVRGTRGLRVVRTGSCSHANILMRKFVIDACLQKCKKKLSLKPQTFCPFTHCCYSSPIRWRAGCRNCRLNCRPRTPTNMNITRGRGRGRHTESYK